jgi:hypothetical protein
LAEVVVVSANAQAAVQANGPPQPTAETAMIDLTREQKLTLVQGARTIPPYRDNRPTHASTLLRWILKGATGPGGRRVRLEAVRIGGRWVTSAEALQRFFERLTPKLDAGVGDAEQLLKGYGI